MDSINKGKWFTEIAIVARRLLEGGFTGKEGKARLKPEGFNAVWCRRLASTSNKLQGIGLLSQASRGSTANGSTKRQRQA
jgi:hypothetical protein